MIPTTIDISNFGPYGQNTHVDFTKYGTDAKVLVVGVNHDSAGADSNGTGKTKLMNAISWVLFNQVPDSVGVDDIIRNGADEVSVAGTFISPDGDELFIKRSRKRNGKHHVWFSINGEDRSKTTATHTQKVLLEYLGILETNKDYYRDFLNTTYFSIDAVKSFAGKESTSADRLNLIARFLNLHILDKCTSRAKVLEAAISGSLDRVEGKIEFLTEKLQGQKPIVEIEADIEEFGSSIKILQGALIKLQLNLKGITEKKHLLTSLDDITEMYNNSQSGIDSLLESFEARISDLGERAKQTAVVENRIIDIKKSLATNNKLPVLAKWTQYREHLQKGKDTITEYKNELRKINTQLANHLLCPSCNTDLMILDGELHLHNIKALQGSQSELEAKIEEARVGLQSFQKKIDEGDNIKSLNTRLEAELKEKQAFISDVALTQEKIDEIRIKVAEQEKNRATQTKAFNTKKSAINTKLIKYTNIDESMERAYMDDIEGNEASQVQFTQAIARSEMIIEEFKKDKKELARLTTESANTRKEARQYQFWIKGFPTIRRWMIENFLPAFEERTNYFLDHMEVGMRVRFATQTQKKNSEDMKNQFDLSIIDETGETRPFETYSQGEVKRIGICVGFALRELTLDRGYNAFKFLMLDEVIDSLDETGVNEFFNLLSHVSGLKFMITHNTDLKTKFSDVLRISKRNGLATISQSA